MTPHMQHVDAKVSKKGVGSSWKTFGKMSSSHDHGQGKFSQDIWRNAFREAYEKLCPIRAGGHECGCLPMLSGPVSRYKNCASTVLSLLVYYCS